MWIHAMNCQQVQDWLLQADDPRPDRCGSPELAGHVEQCDSCRRLADQLVRLEQAWRNIPLPAGADRARIMFLDQMTCPSVIQSLARRSWFRDPIPRRWAVAAVILIAVGAGALLLFQTPPTHAAPDVVERLIDWNLDLTRARSPDERGRIHAGQATRLKEEIQRAKLPPDDRELAETLLANGSWMAENDDPPDVADRFDHLADQLVAQMDTATHRKDARRINRLAALYCRVAEQGVHANLQRAEEDGVLCVEHQKKLERSLRRDTARAEKLTALLEQAPAASRKEIRRAL